MIHVLKSKRYNRVLVVEVGADDYKELAHDRAFSLAKKTAHKRGFYKMRNASPIVSFGQNELLRRRFYFYK